jgi:hypothetical protein
MKKVITLLLANFIGFCSYSQSWNKLVNSSNSQGITSHNGVVFTWGANYGIKKYNPITNVGTLSNTGISNTTIRLFTASSGFNVIHASNNFEIYKSTNDGVNWSLVNMPPESTIHFLKNMGSGYLIAAGNQSVYVSTDDGNSWITPQYIGFVPFGEITDAVLAGDLIYFSHAGFSSGPDSFYGISQLDVNTNTVTTVNDPFAAFAFTSAHNINKVGTNYYLTTANGLYKCNASFDNWQLIPSPNNAGLYSGDFTNINGLDYGLLSDTLGNVWYYNVLMNTWKNISNNLPNRDLISFNGFPEIEQLKVKFNLDGSLLCSAFNLGDYKRSLNFSNYFSLLNNQIAYSTTKACTNQNVTFAFVPQSPLTVQSVSWTFSGNGNQTSNLLSPSISFANTGFVNVELVVIYTNLTTATFTSTNILEIGTAPILDAGANNAICLLDNVQTSSTASNATYYSWNNVVYDVFNNTSLLNPTYNSTANLANNSFITYLELEAFNNFCSIKDSLQVIRNVSFGSSSGSPITLCNGGNLTSQFAGVTALIMLNIIESPAINWTPTTGLSNPNSVYTSVTVPAIADTLAYSLSLNVGSCPSTSEENQLIYVLQSPNVPSITQNINQLISSAGETYTWFLNGDTIAGENSQTLNTTQTGIYSVSVGTYNFCYEVSDDFSFIFTADIEKESAPFFAQINSNTLVIKNALPNSQFSIFDVNGKKLLDTQLITGNETLDCSALSTGVYFYRVNSPANKIENGKMIKL